MSLYFKYHVLLPLLARLPQKTAYRLVSYYGRLQNKQYQAEKAAMMAQMQSVLTLKDGAEERIADYFFAMTEREALDSWFFRRCKSQQQIERFIQLENFDYILDARKAGRRVIISSGHFGRFWMAGVGMKAQGISVGTITRDGGETNVHGLPEVEYQYRLQKLAWLQQCFGGPFLVEGHSVRPVYQALDRHVMALFIDVPYEGDKNGCIEIPFLGKEARFPLGVARIAKKTDALIVPFYVFESCDGLCARFYPPIEAKNFGELEIMRQLVSLLEKNIRQYPEQWWLWRALPLMWQK